MDAGAISRSLLEENWAEADLARGAKVYLQKARALLLERHREGAQGFEIVAAYTAMVDHLIRCLFDAASEDYRKRYPSLSGRCTLVAQGGYGRGELNPFSDIDLLFLHTRKVTPYIESLAEKLLYTLWDAGLDVGHATRTIAACIQLASKDWKVRTALLDARYLGGDRELYRDFEGAVQAYLVKRSAERFIRIKVQETRLRHERYGGSVYLLEPDVKEGEGGLRDIHTALWVAKIRYKVKGLADLVGQEVIQARDLSELKDSQDFLFRVRNELHFSSGKHQDQLIFENQERVAHALGFRDDGAIKGVEAFMGRYYLHASQVNRISSLIIHHVTHPTDGSQLKGRVAGKEVRAGVRVSKGALWISDPAIFAEEPENLLQVFVDAQRHRTEISHRTRELIRERLHLIDDRFRRSATANATFFQILKWKERVYDTLAEMHQSGVLGAFVPEFGRLLCMVLHDLYHIYTVDQHSLRLIRGLERLKSGEFKETLPLLTQLVREVEGIEILYLGCLFHDIGKGYGGGHSEIGMRMAKNIAHRMRLNADDTALLEFLVQHHLLMTHTAFRRDTEDEKLVIDFARTMGSVVNLKMLYLLTYADMQAVAPDVWNNWKGYLLEDLYVQSLRVLEGLEKGEFRREDRRSKVRRIQARLRRRLAARYDSETVRRLLRVMPERYFLTTPEDDMPLHFDLMRRFRRQTYLSSLRHFPEREYSEVAICAKDRPGLFAGITGVFAAFGLDILSARINTRNDGLILDVFRISHGGRPEVVMEERKWHRVGTALEKVLKGTLDVARLVEDSRPSALFKKHAPKVPTEIQIDNDASEEFTIVDVYTQDGIGVLFMITHTLHQLGLSIHLAKISTNVDQVADVFYVTDEQGEKVHDPGRLEQIRQTLYHRLLPEHDGIAQPAH